jgi:hypothetical protein
MPVKRHRKSREKESQKNREWGSTYRYGNVGLFDPTSLITAWRLTPSFLNPLSYIYSYRMWIRGSV